MGNGKQRIWVDSNFINVDIFAEPSLCENQNHHDSHRKPTVKKYEKLLTCKKSSRFIDMLSFPKAFRRIFFTGNDMKMVTRSSFLEVIPTPGTMDAKYIV